MRTRKRFLQIRRKGWCSMLMMFMSVSVLAANNLIEAENATLQDETTKGNIEQMEIKSLDDVLLVFDGEVVSSKQFKKLWNKHFNPQFYFALGTDKKAEKFLDEKYSSSIFWFNRNDETYNNMLEERYRDKRALCAAVVVEKCEDVIGHPHHPCRYLPWKNAAFKETFKADSTTNFILSGTVTKGLRDVAYLINFQEESGNISPKPSAVVLVKDRKFTYRAKLDKPILAEIRAVFEDGSICQTCIQRWFKPGEILHLLVMDNVFNAFAQKLEE